MWGRRDSEPWLCQQNKQRVFLVFPVFLLQMSHSPPSSINSKSPLDFSCINIELTAHILFTPAMIVRLLTQTKVFLLPRNNVNI